MKRIGMLWIIFTGLFAQAQQVIPLYTGIAPGSLPVADKETFSTPSGGRPFVTNVTRPTLTVFMPQRPNAARTAIIICPGGGYSRLSIEDGGYEAAKALAEAGVVAFVLKYRTWQEGAYTSYKNIPLQDLRQAMMMVRAGAEKMNIDTAHIGLLGFSAGGHLAAMAASSPAVTRPAFTLLVYPVISFTDELTSARSTSRNTLLGRNSSPAEKKAFSPELQVSAATPPTFIVQAEDDSTSLVGNSIAYYQALVANRIPAQLLLYQKGGHGFALYNKAQDEHWMPAAIKWLALNGLYLPK
jgi:acetyl esterase/lipase